MRGGRRGYWEQQRQRSKENDECFHIRGMTDLRKMQLFLSYFLPLNRKSKTESLINTYPINRHSRPIFRGKIQLQVLDNTLPNTFL